MQLSIVEIKEIRFENSRGDNSNSIFKQEERCFNVFDIFWEMENSVDWTENVCIFIYEEENYQQMNNGSSLFQPKT